jgi:HEPN domain-containing protein
VTSPSDSTYSEDWLAIARRDWDRVQRALSAPDPELAAFLLQQCLEKYLKAFLLARGWNLKRTHSLTVLLDEACTHDPNLEEHRDLCDRVSGYYLLERYPVLGVASIAASQVADDRDAARLVILALYPSETLPN